MKSPRDSSALEMRIRTFGYFAMYVAWLLCVRFLGIAAGHRKNLSKDEAKYGVQCDDAIAPTRKRHLSQEIRQ